MLRIQKLSDVELINFSHQWRRSALQGAAKAIDQALRHESEVRHRFSKIYCSVVPTGGVVNEVKRLVAADPMTVTESASEFMVATADSATQSAEALQVLLHNLRVLLEMDIAFVAEFIDGKKIYRHVDQDEERPACVKVNDSVPLEATLCQRVVDERLPSYLCDAQSHPEMASVTTTNASHIKAYLSAPVVLRDGSTYGTLCCISHTPRSALGSRQVDSLRYVAGIVAKELEKSRG